MSAEEVTVSLSRLALAKAIKTPDAGEEEAEPWSKSIIFHQSHIDSEMRHSIVSPHQNRRRPGQRQQPLLHKNQRQQRNQYPPHMNRTRSEELHRQPQSRYNTLQQHPSQQQLAQVKTNGNVGHTNIKVTKSAGTKSGRYIVPSDDEEEEEEEDDEVDDEDDEDDEPQSLSIVMKDTKKKIQNKNLTQREISEVDSKHEVKVVQQSKLKEKSRRQQPSDDEESEEDSHEGYDKDDKENESDRNSLDNGHEGTNALVAEQNQQTYARRMSTLRQLEKGSNNPRRRSRSLSDMQQFTLPLPHIGEQDTPLNVVEEWQKTMDDVENITGTSSGLSDIGSSALTEEETVEEPIVSTNTPLPPQTKANYRVSTLGEMDFYQYQQQQQMAFHNMQMQQAMQMAQIQQYQQVMMQQQLMSNYDPRMTHNRQSAMDLMMQMEQEKSSSRKNNGRKKPINTSNVSLKDGLLSRVPEQRQHNISFQGQMMSNNRTRTSKSDYNLKESRNRSSSSSSRPPSSMAMYYDNARAGSSMGMDPRAYSQMTMGRSESPMPTVSMSTPLQPMMGGGGQYISPNSGRVKSRQLQQPMMTSSRSTGRASHMPSSRQSTNWGTKSKERLR